MDCFYSLSRLKNEYEDIKRNSLCNLGCTVSLFNEGNIYEWKVTLFGAKDTMYKYGLFVLKLVLPKEYPNKPPELYFITPIYHLNVNPKKSDSPYSEHLGHVSVCFLNQRQPHQTPKEI